MPLTRRDLLARSAFGALPLLGLPTSDGAPQPPRPARPPRTRDYVVEASAALVYRQGSPQVIENASVRVRDNEIVEVREGRIPGTVARIDATGQLLLPGLISGHTHAASGSPTRGLIEGGRSYQRPIELPEAPPDDPPDDITAHNVAQPPPAKRGSGGYASSRGYPPTRPPPWQVRQVGKEAGDGAEKQ